MDKRVVPVEPTHQMIMSGVNRFSVDFEADKPSPICIMNIYKAMIAAAPPAPQVTDEQISEIALKHYLSHPEGIQNIVNAIRAALNTGGRENNVAGQAESAIEADRAHVSPAPAAPVEAQPDYDRLERRLRGGPHTKQSWHELCDEAADAIAAMRGEVERWKQANPEVEYAAVASRKLILEENGYWRERAATAEAALAAARADERERIAEYLEKSCGEESFYSNHVSDYIECIQMIRALKDKA